MKKYSGLIRELILSQNLKSKELKRLPLKISWYLHTTFKNEKISKMNGKYVISTFMPPFPSRAFEQLIKNTVAVYNHNVFPYSAYLAVTNECKFNCWHCSKAYRQGDEITKEKWIEVIKKLQDLGVSIIGFTGGEPLLRADLEDIIKSIDDRTTTILFTTGDGLTDERARSLKEAGLSYLAISLDHYDKAVHNKLRGLDRAFDTAIQAIRTSVKSGFYTAVQLTPRRELLNKKEMDKYIKFVSELGVEEIRIIEPMPTGRLLKNHADILLTEADHKFIKQYHINTNRDNKLPKIASFVYLEDKDLYGCGAGIQHIHIDALGNICPCDFTPLSFGNIKNEDLEAIYQRVKEQFNKPRNRCFILENADKISACFEKNLPLNYEDSVKICDKCTRGELPKFYKKLGWDEY